MTYREFSPPAVLAPFVECFWTHGGGSPEPKRVLPDNCIDLLVFFGSGSEPRLDLVGAMTRARIFDVSADGHYVGIRFRPGGAAALPASATSPT